LDYPEEPYFEAKVILDTLQSPSPSLTRDEYRGFYNLVSEDYADVASKTERRELLRKDPYLNALQIKFAYALTCHKAQGGQWKAVFVDQGYLKEEQIDAEYIRWLYTAITRSTHELFLVNFHERFFD
jgi:superfamily I DNA/RNA helicase